MIGISGIGCISAWGINPKDFYENARSRSSALSSFSRFQSEGIKLKEAGFLREEFNASDFFEKKRVRRYDIFSRLAISSAVLAFRSDREYLEQEKEEIGLTYACETQSSVTADYLKDLFTDGPDLVSPKLFPTVSANATGSNIAIELGIKGPNLNLSSKFGSGFVSLFNSYNLIQAGHVRTSLAGSVDYLSQIVMEAYSRFGAYGEGGIIPGEGAVSMLLSKDSEKYGKILGISFECSRTKNYEWPTDSGSHARVLLNASKDLKINQIYSLQNGVEQLAEMERRAIVEAFGTNFPVVSLKNCFGEMGTAPLVQACAALCEDKGVRTLISVASPGGIHGAFVVESSGAFKDYVSNI